MSGANGSDGPVRDALREVLRELLPELLGAERPADARHGHPAPPETALAADVVPQVPPPPVAAVHRPSTWASPLPAPLEPARPEQPPAPVAAPSGVDVEEVALDTDADLQAFVLRLVRLCDNPRDRQRLRAGRLRFALRQRAGAAATAAVGQSVRVERGAVTERVVADAAAQGARLVLGPRAVLTPMGRDRAKALGVEIERERRC